METVLFVLLSSAALLFSALPDREFSELENRYLTQQPAFTAEALLDGSYAAKVDEYLADQFPARDFWIKLKVSAERMLGKQENNGVYFAKQDTLLNRLDEPDWKELESKAEYLRIFSEKAGVPVSFGLIPTSSAIWRNRLPYGAASADEEELISALYAAVPIPGIDLYGALSEHAEEEIFYRTDHHWTSLGAFYGANAILEALNRSSLVLTDYKRKTVSEQFFGTIYSAACAYWIKPDRIDTYVEGESLRVITHPMGQPVESTLYLPENLNKKDQYTYFLGGNQPLNVIFSMHTEAPKLLLLRDSYADCLVPFLTERFSEVHMIDLRYYRLSIPEYIKNNEIDQVVILYGLSSFLTDKNLFLLTR